MARYTYAKRRAASIKKSAANRRKAVWKSRFTPKFKTALRARQTRKIGRNLMPKYGFLPDKVCCRLKATSEPFTLDPGTGGIAVVQNLKFNTPYAGFNGRQPREWDEMIALYRKCFVVGAKITVTSLPVLTGGDVATVWGVYTVKYNQGASGISVIDHDLPDGLTYADITEDHRLMKGTRKCTHAYGPSKFSTMTKKWSAKKWSGLSDYINGGEETYSQSSSDIGGDLVAGCNVWAVNRSNLDSSAVTFNACIEYICVFTDRNTVNPST